jgi:hypothetical protein
MRTTAISLNINKPIKARISKGNTKRYSRATKVLKISIRPVHSVRDILVKFNYKPIKRF